VPVQRSMRGLAHWPAAPGSCEDVVIIVILLFLIFDWELNDGRWSNALADWLNEELYRIGLA
jgi:hypothetical protein